MRRIILCFLSLILLCACGAPEVVPEPPVKVVEQEVEEILKAAKPAPEVLEPAPQAAVKEDPPKAEEPITPPETKPEKAPEEEEEKPLCTLSITCEKAVGKKENLPENGVLLNAVTVEFTEGESVFDVLKRCLAEKGIALEYREDATFKSIYIVSIGPLSEKDCGAYSGWMYKVNGTPPTYASSEYKLKDGDVIEFYYSC